MISPAGRRVDPKIQPAPGGRLCGRGTGGHEGEQTGAAQCRMQGHGDPRSLLKGVTAEAAQLGQGRVQEGPHALVGTARTKGEQGHGAKQANLYEKSGWVQKALVWRTHPAGGRACGAYQQRTPWARRPAPITGLGLANARTGPWYGGGHPPRLRKNRESKPTSVSNAGVATHGAPVEHTPDFCGARGMGSQ